MVLYRVLMDFGFTEKQAKVYLAFLELGPSPIQKVIKKTLYSRPTVYAIVDELVELGFIIKHSNHRNVIFEAISPDDLVDILIEREKQKIQENTRFIESLLPELKEIQAENSVEPVVRFFEGKQGVKEMVNEVFRYSFPDNDRVVRVIYPREALFRIFTQEEIKEFVEARKKAKIDYKALYCDESDIYKDDEKSLRISSNLLKIDCDIAVYGDQVRIILLKEPLMGIIIKDKNIADSFANIFDYIYSAVEQGLLN